MPVLFIFLCLIQCAITLKCYDCTNCPYPWSSFGIETYGSILGVFSRVRSCYKKEFYSPVDRRLDRVARGALDRDCIPGKLETINERSITYCCYSSYCNRAQSKQPVKHVIIKIIVLLILVIFIIKE